MVTIFGKNLWNFLSGCMLCISASFWSDGSHFKVKPDKSLIKHYRNVYLFTSRDYSKNFTFLNFQLPPDINFSWYQIYTDVLCTVFVPELHYPQYMKQNKTKKYAFPICAKYFVPICNTIVYPIEVLKTSAQKRYKKTYFCGQNNQIIFKKKGHKFHTCGISLLLSKKNDKTISPLGGHLI